jgi:hypothetical protein
MYIDQVSRILSENIGQIDQPDRQAGTDEQDQG